MFFDRISASFALARSSWDVLRKDKQLLLFPVLSGIGCTLVLLSFVVPIGVIAYVGDGSIRSSRAVAGGLRVAGAEIWAVAPWAVQ